MTKTKVVHCNKDSYDILIDRTTMWGNPFKIGKDGDRTDVIVKFDLWLNGKDFVDFKQPKLQKILNNIDQLDGQTIACWCKPRECHGDIYVKFIEYRKSGILQM